MRLCAVATCGIPGRLSRRSGTDGLVWSSGDLAGPFLAGEVVACHGAGLVSPGGERCWPADGVRRARTAGGCSLTLWVTPVRVAASTIVRCPSTPHGVTAARWPLRCKFGNAGASAGRPLSRLQLAQMPVSTARLGRFDPTVAPDPGPSVKTRTERRFAGSRRTSTRTCFPLAAVLTTPADLASPLAVISGRSQSQTGQYRARQSPVLVLVVRGANALQAMPHARKPRDPQVSHSPKRGLGAPARTLSRQTERRDTHAAQRPT